MLIFFWGGFQEKRAVSIKVHMYTCIVDVIFGRKRLNVNL